MTVRRGPWNVVSGQNKADTINTLRALADELEQDADILGAAVVVVREGPRNDYELVSCGKLARSKEVAFYALQRVLYWMVYKK